MLNLPAVRCVDLYCRVHVHVHSTRCGQIIDGSCDAHLIQRKIFYLMRKMTIDDSAFLFNQREKSFTVYWVYTQHLNHDQKMDTILTEVTKVVSSQIKGAVCIKIGKIS